ncbi:hypothetical protein BDP55DRAFT_657020 [Colletotrichum godetiae]|uniref:Uncharacterized protein n=1 Tax=Colletotrichum godetiae TaxID=1209918 RepID=A0AAJ0APV7_9PEZI|nr:uncharacterized protein BDP55DRAFT_657020 [Colletotrichum godetiae]KAK1688184.1 hypothetical protein BDP55DRAFT_657020 [Colletotrichum godetiae]
MSDRQRACIRGYVIQVLEVRTRRNIAALTVILFSSVPWVFRGLDATQTAEERRSNRHSLQKRGELCVGRGYANGERNPAIQRASQSSFSPRQGTYQSSQWRLSFRRELESAWYYCVTASTHLPYFEHTNWNSRRVPFRSETIHLPARADGAVHFGAGRCVCTWATALHDMMTYLTTPQSLRATKALAEGSSHKKAHDKNERKCLGLVNNRLIFAQPHQSRQGTGGGWMGWARMQKVAAVSRKKKQRADHSGVRYG